MAFIFARVVRWEKNFQKMLTLVITTARTSDLTWTIKGFVTEHTV
jgi:hypothetical protein